MLPSSQPALKAIEAELALASRSGVKADLVQKARLLSAQTLSHAKVLVPADPGVKRLQAIIYGQLQRAMLGELSSAAALAAAEKEWNAYAVARWP